MESRSALISGQSNLNVQVVAGVADLYNIKLLCANSYNLIASRASLTAMDDCYVDVGTGISGLSRAVISAKKGSVTGTIRAGSGADITVTSGINPDSAATDEAGLMTVPAVRNQMQADMSIIRGTGTYTAPAST